MIAGISPCYALAAVLTIALSSPIWHGLSPGIELPTAWGLADVGGALAFDPSGGATDPLAIPAPDDLGIALQQPWTWAPLLRRIWLGWLVAIGAATGSFLNVVVYRGPRGQSLSYPPSRCPECLHPIRPWHNVPVLGWLWLRGKCHDCGARISPRYPLVEALVAALFGVLAAREVFTAGGNLPYDELWVFRSEPRPSTPLALPGAPAVWYLYAYHAWLWSALVAAALIARDRQRLPGVVFWPTLAAAIAGPSLIAGLHPVSTQIALPDNAPAWMARAISPLAGAIAGATIALAASLAVRTSSPSAFARYAPLIWVGGFLGWQAACALAVLSSLLRMVSFGKPTWPAALAIATICWTLAWSSMVDASGGLFGKDAPGLLALFAAALCAGFEWCAARLFARANLPAASGS